MAGLGSWGLQGALSGGGPEGPVGFDTAVNIPLHPKLQPGRGAPGARAHMYLGNRGSWEAHQGEALWETREERNLGIMFRRGTWGNTWR